MEVSKLNTIIIRQNERRERHALDEAENLIEQIACKQQGIIKTQAEIADLRKRLNDLQVEQLDATSILGGE